MAVRRKKKPTLALVNAGKGKVLRRKRKPATMSITILPPINEVESFHIIVETETRQPIRLKKAVVLEVEDDAIGGFGSLL